MIASNRWKDRPPKCSPDYFRAGTKTTIANILRELEEGLVYPLCTIFKTTILLRCRRQRETAGPINEPLLLVPLAGRIFLVLPPGLFPCLPYWHLLPVPFNWIPVLVLPRGPLYGPPPPPPLSYWLSRVHGTISETGLLNPYACGTTSATRLLNPNQTPDHSPPLFSGTLLLVPFAGPPY